jgi:6-phosphogluconolactonase/glucosamine-6-phosphate isomerase/deaminase
MSETARLLLDGKEYEFPVVTGSENEKAIDIGKLRALTGYITLDSGYKNTGATTSAITFLDGEDGLLRSRGSEIDELAAHARDGFVPDFDVVLLGMGPEGHVASLFPHMAALHAGTSTAPIPDSPKPPPERVTMTLASIRSARHVWIVASGESKAQAAALAVDPATSMIDLPAAGARGREGTCLWLDQAAASLL